MLLMLVDQSGQGVTDEMKGEDQRDGARGEEERLVNGQQKCKDAER